MRNVFTFVFISYLFMHVFIWAALTWLSRHCQQPRTHWRDNCRLPATTATSHHVTALSGYSVKECNEAGASGRVDRMSGNHLEFKLNSQGHLSSFFFFQWLVKNPWGSTLNQPGLIHAKCWLVLNTDNNYLVISNLFGIIFEVFDTGTKGDFALN